MFTKRFLIYSPQHPAIKEEKLLFFFFYFPNGITMVQRSKVTGLVNGLSLNLGLAPSHYTVTNMLFFTREAKVFMLLFP